MDYLSVVDYAIIGGYLSFLVILGVILKRKASTSMEDYFLGGRQLPWWLLGVSGMANFLDITGTMVITSFLFMLGPRGLYVEFRGGAVLVLAFMMLWAGKYHRRSGCITGAEWMLFRFGDGPGGRFAQLAAVVGMIVTTIGMMAYLVKGMGLFLSTFLPFDPFVCALVMVTVAAVYTMMSGFYGVVYTDLFQSVLILGATLAISALAFTRLDDIGHLREMAGAVTGNHQWTTSWPSWRTNMPEGYKPYEDLFMFMVFYFLKNAFQGMAGGADPKYFGARSDAACGKLSFQWICLMTFRWPMMMGIAVLGILMVYESFPNPGQLAESAALIKQFYPEAAKPQWASVIAQVIRSGPDVNPNLAGGLQSILGPAWVEKVRLVSFDGTVEAERILPAVLKHVVPQGLRGVMLVSLLAASMSTFDSSVNMATGFWTRDIYQKYLRPRASMRELVYASWSFIAAVVVLGFLFAYTVENINDIWGWITMGLTAGLLVPGFLRLYWWRFNGSGFATGTFAGIVGAVVQRGLYPELDERWQFVLLLGVGLAGAVAGTYLAPPTRRDVLETFYRATRPMGFWRPFLRALPEEAQRDAKREHRRDLLGVPFAVVWQVTLFLLPMQVIIKAWSSFFVTLAVCGVALAGLVVFWLRHQREDPETRDQPVVDVSAP